MNPSRCTDSSTPGDSAPPGFSASRTGAGVGSSVVPSLQRSTQFRSYRSAFETITGLPLVLREAGSFRTPLEGSRQLNRFCAMMMNANKTCASCLQVQGRLEAEATDQPKTLQCYAGLSESVVPVRLGGRVLCYLQTGQVFFRRPARRKFDMLATTIGAGLSAAGLRELQRAYFQTRIMPHRDYDAILSLLTLFAEHLAMISSQIILASVVGEPIAVARGRLFIAEHYREDIRLSTVARAVHTSLHYFCRIFRKATGMTFTEYVARERTEAVKGRLLDANTRISEAAYSCGFQSLSQFNRVFRTVEGESPRGYRDRVQSLVAKPTRGPTLIIAA